jgi:hypothetical protein
MKQYMVGIMILISLEYLHADKFFNGIKQTQIPPSPAEQPSKDAKMLKKDKDSEKESEVSALPGMGEKRCKKLTLAEENLCLKSHIKSLETEIERLRMGKSAIEKPIEPVVIKEANTQKVLKGTKLKIFEKAPEKLPTYYIAKLQSLDALKSHLELYGFTVLAVTPVLEGKTVVTVTNDRLKQTNTLLATLQILVDAAGEIRVQNPSYFGAAYLQDRYRYGEFADVLKSLQGALGEMYEAEERFELSDLENYQFMFGMPYLKDTITVAEGDDLFDRVTGKGAEHYVAYTLMLPNGDMIVGHKLRNSTNRFLEKIGVAYNANILPYESIIKGKKAVILDPKYYLALSLPLLKMSDFMKIADTPGEIEKDIKRAYVQRKTVQKEQ